MTELTITLGWPPANCWPNSRPAHWGHRHRDRKLYRMEAKLHALARLRAENGPRWSRAVARATFVLPNRRHWPDADNALAALKAVWDGLEDAGVLSNDRGLTHLPVERVVSPGCAKHVIVTVREANDAGDSG